MIHDFAEVVFFAEDVLIGSRSLEGGLVTGGAKQRLHLTGGATGGGNDALGVLRKNFAVHARLVVDAIEVGLRRQPKQVVHALGGLG